MTGDMRASSSESRRAMPEADVLGPRERMPAFGNAAGQSRMTGKGRSLRGGARRKGRQAVVRRKRDLDWQSLRLRTFGSRSTGRPNCIAAVRIGAIIPSYIRALLARPKLSKHVFDFPIDRIAIGHRPTQSSISGRFLHVQIRAVGDRIFNQRAITDVDIGMGSRRKLERRASDVVDGIDVRTILRCARVSRRAYLSHHQRPSRDVANFAPFPVAGFSIAVDASL